MMGSGAMDGLLTLRLGIGYYVQNLSMRKAGKGSDPDLNKLGLKWPIRLRRTGRNDFAKVDQRRRQCDYGC